MNRRDTLLLADKLVECCAFGVQQLLEKYADKDILSHPAVVMVIAPDSRVAGILLRGPQAKDLATKIVAAVGDDLRREFPGTPIEGYTFPDDETPPSSTGLN
jgi:hypothetical protein